MMTIVEIFEERSRAYALADRRAAKQLQGLYDEGSGGSPPSLIDLLTSLRAVLSGIRYSERVGPCEVSSPPVLEISEAERDRLAAAIDVALADRRQARDIEAALASASEHYFFRRQHQPAKPLHSSGDRDQFDVMRAQSITGDGGPAALRSSAMRGELARIAIRYGTTITEVDAFLAEIESRLDIHRGGIFGEDVSALIDLRFGVHAAPRAS